MTFYRRHPALEERGAALVESTLAKFKSAGLNSNQLSLTLVLPGQDATPLGFGYRSDCSAYPASVIKLFYLVAAHGWLEARRLRRTPELDRALAAMIQTSSNDATNYVLDLLTGTSGGPELPEAALRRWLARRRAVNRYFARWRWPELADFNATQKTWDEGPYGREQQSRLVPNNRNRLTTDAVARLLFAIDSGAVVSPARSAEMLSLLARPLPGEPVRRHGDPEDQVTGFFGEALPAGTKLWSKAGWTSDARHDAAVIALPGGPKFILVALTEGAAQSANLQLLPFIANQAAEIVTRLATRAT